MESSFPSDVFLRFVGYLTPSKRPSIRPGVDARTECVRCVPSECPYALKGNGSLPRQNRYPARSSYDRKESASVYKAIAFVRRSFRRRRTRLRCRLTSTRVDAGRADGSCLRVGSRPEGAAPRGPRRSQYNRSRGLYIRASNEKHRETRYHGSPGHRLVAENLAAVDGLFRPLRDPRAYPREVDRRAAALPVRALILTTSDAPGRLAVDRDRIGTGSGRRIVVATVRTAVARAEVGRSSRPRRHGRTG